MLRLIDILPPSEDASYWSIDSSLDEELPGNERFIVLEYYCDQPACHCRSLVANIVPLGSDGKYNEKPVAIINYDWSTKELACKPTLHETSPQSDHALALLKYYKDLVHNEEYRTRIQSHYTRVKELASAKLLANYDETLLNQKIKIERNDPCNCGSGKKYKKCCLVA